ncbi:MAG: glycosyltransferase family 4 protein [Clostridiales bacterium]|nr:glycosyltransferase family 4 protein [Clostridiales bacterium]
MPRTIAIADQFKEIHFIDTVGNADRNKLEAHGIFYYSSSDINGSCVPSLGLQRLFQKINPDVIVAHYASGDHFFNAVLFGKCPVASVCMGHDVLYSVGDSNVPFFRRLLTRLALRQNIYISAKSRYLAECIKSYRVKGWIDVNYWGTDFTCFKPDKAANERRNLGLHINNPVILSPRAVEPRLNIIIIVQAFKKVVEIFPNAQLVVLGRSFVEYKAKVAKLVSDLDLVDNVNFVDEVSQAVLPDYYYAADVVVSMASSEGFPNTILEVMSCDIPVVVGRIPQIEELLIDGYNAKLCGFESSEVAQAIIDILDNPEKSGKIVANARKTVTAYGDIRKNAIRFSNQLKEAVTQGKKSNGFFYRVVFLLVYLIYVVQRKFFIR